MTNKTPASTYTRPAALTVLAVAAGSWVLADARGSKIKFMSFVANSAAQSDYLGPATHEPQIVAGSWQAAIKGSPRLKTVEDPFAHEFRGYFDQGSKSFNV